MLRPSETYVYNDDCGNFYTIIGSPKTGYMVTRTCLRHQHLSGNAFGDQELVLDTKRPKKRQHIFKTLSRAEQAVTGSLGWSSPFSSCEIGQQ